MTTATISLRDKTFRNAQRDGDNLCGSRCDMPVWTGDPRELQAVALAAKFNMTAGWARFFTGLRDGREIYRVQSHTLSTRRYEVTYDPHRDRVTDCTCPSYTACSHMGAVRLWVERRKVRAALAERAAWMEA